MGILKNFRKVSGNSTDTKESQAISVKSSRFTLDHKSGIKRKLESLQSERSELSIPKGTFVHLKKKNKKIYYDEILQQPDPYFHVDVGAHCDSYFRGQKVRFKEKKAEHFASVVDLDAYEYHKVVFHTFLNEILQSVFFRSLILFLVMLNAVMIGIQTFPSVTDNPRVYIFFSVVDQIVLSVFIFEILLKWLYDFRLFWRTAWNVLDFTIIFLIISPTILPNLLGNGRALVTVRVVRAFRSLRSVSSMASLSIVSHTVVKSGRDMANIIMVLIVFMLVMSVMGVILFDLEEINLPNFINGLDAWYTVFICVTQDGWADLLETFINFGGPEHENYYDKFLVIYLLIAVSAGGFVFANLIVAVIVTNLEMAVKEFRDEKAMSDNPLEFHSDHMSSEVDILCVHDLLARDNTALIAQRPFKIPSLKKISLRRLQSYIGLIVALEHNMLEAEIIHKDLEKVMAVIVSTMTQLDVYKNQRRLEDEKQKAIKEFNEYASAATMIPTDKVTQIETLQNLNKYKALQQQQQHMQHQQSLHQLANLGQLNQQNQSQNQSQNKKEEPT